MDNGRRQAEGQEEGSLSNFDRTKGRNCTTDLMFQEMSVSRRFQCIVYVTAHSAHIRAGQTC